jgi:hypothetical protein
LPLYNAKACEALAERLGLLPFGLGRSLPIVNDLLIIAFSLREYGSAPARKNTAQSCHHQHSEQLVSGRNGVKLGACGAGLNVMSNSQNNIVMTDENKIIGDAFAIFV